MRILDRSVYVGPSHYARFPVIRLELDLGELEAWPTGRLGAGYIDGLAAALPGLAEHGCSYREPGGFFRRMREGGGAGGRPRPPARPGRAWLLLSRAGRLFPTHARRRGDVARPRPRARRDRAAERRWRRRDLRQDTQQRRGRGGLT